MKNRSFLEFTKQSFNNFITATFNIIIFLPYFFSVGTFLKTLFQPWKNVTSKKEGVGFSFDEWFGRITMNIVSRVIGALLKLTVILLYLIIQLAVIIFLPLALTIFILSLPARFWIRKLSESEEQKKARLRESFLKTHLLKKEHLNPVLAWFETYYQEFFVHSSWWAYNNLFANPPFGRDWASGYTPTMDQYASELTTTTYQARIRHALDRTNEIEQIETILTKNHEANIILVGDNGVGKHTVIDAMARKIYEGTINPLLVYKRILKLDLEQILNQYTDQKKREALLEDLFSEAYEAKNIILMIENLDKYIVSSTDRVNLAVPIEKFAKLPNFHFISTTTPFAYQKFIFSSDQIAPLFSKIDIKEIDKDTAFEILLQKTLLFEARNTVIIPYETVQNVIEKSDFFITRTPFPEKAIELLDSVVAQTVEKKHSKNDLAIISPDLVDTVLTQITHVPTQLNADLKDKLVNMQNYLSTRVIFQEEAIDKLSATMRRSLLFLGKRKKPLVNFLFLGPTGVGKTETAKALSELFFGKEKNLLRFDMSLFQSKNDIAKLIGSADSESPGLLTQAIRETPFGVLLLDEIEKADKDLLNIFLTILDEGYFTDGLGRRVDCKNLMIIATSNAGSDFIFKKLTVGDTSFTTESLINHLIGEKYFSPEFLNRFDGVIAYRPLTENTVLELAKRVVKKIAENYAASYKINVQISDTTLQEIIHKGYHPEFGARDLERLVTSEVEDKVAKEILEEKVGEGQTLSL